MKQNLFNKLWLRVGMIVAIMTTALSGTAWAQATVGTTLWAETWTGATTATSGSNSATPSANYGHGTTVYNSGTVSYTQSANSVYVRNDTYAGGTAPELMLTSSQTWTISNIPTGSATELTLSYKSNNTKSSVTCSTTGVSISGSSKSYTITTNGAATITLVFGCSGNTRIDDVELTVKTAGGGSTLTTSDLALTDAPIALNFDLYNNSAAQTISFTSSSTGDVTVSESDYVTTVVNQNAKTIIVTPTAVTPSAQTITVSQAADATYAAASATFTVNITDSTPFNGVIFDATEDTGTSPITKDNVSFACNNGVLNNGTEYRMYKNSITTISTTDNSLITKIEFTGVSGNPASGFSDQTGWTTAGYNGVWEGEAESVSFTASGAQVRATLIKVTVEANTNPFITADDFEIAYSATGGNIAYELGNPVDGATLQAVVASGATISNFTLGTVGASPITFTCAANAETTAKTAAVTLNYVKNNETLATKNVTITQAGNPNGLGTENNPYTVTQALAATPATGVYVTGTISAITEVSTEHGNATYTITDGTNTMIIYRGKYLDNVNFTSANQITIGDVVVVTGNLSEYQGVNQLAQGNHIVSIESASTTPIINADDVNIAYDATSGEITYTITHPADGVTLSATTDADWVSNITVTAEKVTFSTTANETGSIRMATFTLTYTGATPRTVKVTQAKQIVNGNYTLATTITSGKSYVIVGEHEGTYYVMGEQASNNRHGVEATVTAGVLSVSNEYEFVIAGNDTDGYTIYDGNGYLYAASSSANQLKTQATNNTNGIWTITIGGTASIVAESSSNRNVMQFNYNSGSPIFACYAADKPQSPVYLFEKVEAETEEVTVTAAGYATYCSENALDFTNTDIKAYVGTKSGEKLTFKPATQVPAGTGLLLVYEGGKTENVPVIASATAVEGNCLEGVNVETAINSNDYILNVVNGGAGFYKAGTWTTLGAHKAYIPAAVGNGVKGFTIDFDDDATGISLMEDGRSQMEDGVIYNVAGQRISKMQKGINIVNGKKILK